MNEAVSNKEYSATAWMEDAEAVQTAALDPTPPPLHDASGLRAGMLRRASYSGTMMGSKVRNVSVISQHGTEPSLYAAPTGSTASTHLPKQQLQP